MMRINLGTVYRAVLDLNSAQRTHREALALSEREGLTSNFTGTIAAELCADCALAGAWDEAYAYAQRALATRHDEVLPFGFSRWPEVEALARAGERERATAEVWRFGELVGHNARYRLLYLRALAALTSIPDASSSPEPTTQERGDLTRVGERVKLLREAIAIAEELGLPGELWQLYAALGDWGRAQEIVQSLAERIQAEPLKEAFLAAGPVQQVLTGQGW